MGEEERNKLLAWLEERKMNLILEKKCYNTVEVM